MRFWLGWPAVARPVVDPDRVRRLLEMLQRYRGLLTVPDDDPFRRRHLVQTAAQICIDLANHVAASAQLRTPTDYGDAFRVLQEQGILGEELADRMVALAGARNVIVHLYAEVDDELLSRTIRHGGLDDLDAYAAAIAGLV